MRALLAAAAVLATLAANGCSPSTAKEAAVPPPAVTAPVMAGAVNPAVKVTTYACADGQTVVAGYPDQSTAILTYKGHAYTLKIGRSADGARYVGYGLQWWTKGMSQGQLATLKPGEEIASAAGVSCTAKGAGDDVSPPAPGAPGGLPDDKTPISETPFSADSAQGAANVVQTYYALVEAGKYAEAGKLRGDGQAGDFSPYASYHAQIGAPGESEGAAGSIFVDVPVVIYGRYKTGAELHQSGKVVLRRVNDVPGSTAAQRRWHIDRIELTPTK
jgi:membrane-bound inhibitor of C-type lysozyme